MNSNQRSLEQFLNLLHVLTYGYNGVTRRQYRRHAINDFLAFGFRKDDVQLEPLKDTRSNEISLPRIEYWSRNKLLKFLNHGEGLGIRVKNEHSISVFAEGVENILTLAHHQSGPNGSSLMVFTADEIRGSIILLALLMAEKCLKEGQILAGTKRDAIKQWSSVYVDFQGSVSSEDPGDNLPLIIEQIQVRTEGA